MSILGYTLMIIGSIYCLGRIFNQREIYMTFLRISSRDGIITGLSKWFTMEIIMGFGMGVFLLSLGYYFVYDDIPENLIFGLFSFLFYILSTQVSFINIRDRLNPTKTSMIQIRYPILFSITPFGHPFFLILLYVGFGIIISF